MFIWKDELLVGLKEIDDEHKELFALFQSLSSDIGADRDVRIIKSAVAYLDEYVQTHFDREERYMEEVNYPDEKEHKKEHKKFTRDFSRLKAQIRKNGKTSLWAAELEELVRDWFVRHIQETDRKLAKLLRKKLMRRS